MREQVEQFKEEANFEAIADRFLGIMETRLEEA